MFNSSNATLSETALPGLSARLRSETESATASGASMPHQRARHWAGRIIFLVLLLTCLQVQATDYFVPLGPLPSGCNLNSGGTVTCGPLTLAASDTINVATATSILIQGDFNTGASVKINADSPDASKLTIYVTGITTLGASNVVHANIVGSNKTAGTITTGDNTTIIGDLSTGTKDNKNAGVINIGDGNKVTGNITTWDGAINIGDSSVINGNILVVNAGAILLHINVTMNGNVSSTVQGSDSGAGAITIYGGSQVNGSINTFTGAITVEVAPTGSKQTKVTGNIGTSAGAITVATHVAVDGSVCVGSAGAITIGAYATIGGNVEVANDGAITIGTYATVAGDVTTKDARTIGEGAKVGKDRIGATCGVGTPDPTPPPRVLSRTWRQLFVR